MQVNGGIGTYGDSSSIMPAESGQSYGYDTISFNAGGTAGGNQSNGGDGYITITIA